MSQNNPDKASMKPAGPGENATKPPRTKNTPDAFGKLAVRRQEIPIRMKPDIRIRIMPQKNVAPVKYETRLAAGCDVGSVLRIFRKIGKRFRVAAKSMPVILAHKPIKKSFERYAFCENQRQIRAAITSVGAKIFW
jgi:hypothetical protein